MFVKLNVRTDEGNKEMWFNPHRISRIEPTDSGSIVWVDEGKAEPSEFHVEEGPLDIDNRSYRAAQGRFSHQKLEDRGMGEAGRAL